MDRRRLRFAAALALFIIWVAALATLAIVAGRRPPDRNAVTAPR